MQPFRPFFLKSLKDHYPDEANLIIAATDIHYKKISTDTAFAATSGNPVDKRLDFTAYFLALIKTLDERGESYETIRKICIEITTNYVQPTNKLQAYIKQLIPKLTHTWIGQRLIKVFHNKVSVNSSPDGFIANIITDKNETYGLGYGIDIIECGICKLFKKHNYQKFSGILCEVDEITSGLAGLQLIRTGTIANGAKKCDFRFKRIQ
jgi:hypothetical protein